MPHKLRMPRDTEVPIVRKVDKLATIWETIFSVYTVKLNGSVNNLLIQM